MKCVLILIASAPALASNELPFRMDGKHRNIIYSDGDGDGDFDGDDYELNDDDNMTNL